MAASTKPTALQSSLWILHRKLKEELGKYTDSQDSVSDSDFRADVSSLATDITELDYSRPEQLLRVLADCVVILNWDFVPGFLPELNTAIASLVHQLDIQLNESIYA